MVSTSLDIIITASSLAKPYGPIFAMVAGPLKEMFFPGDEPPDFKKLLDNLSTEIQVKKQL